jgi:hypothetical protein
MTRTKADELKEWIQKDSFWDEVKATVEFFIPLVRMLREFDGNSPQSSWLYWTLSRGFVDLQKSMQNCFLVTQDIATKMEKMYTTRQKSLTTDFMLAAAYLNPLMFFNEDLDVAGNSELSRGFKSYIARYAEYKITAGPNHDHEVQALIRKIQMQSLEAQQKLPTSSVSPIATQSAINDMSPGEWWHLHGADYKELRIMAKKICHQKMSASSCKCNWSAYGFIHSKSRNKLTNDRAKDLVFVFTNMRVEKGLTKIRNPHAAIYNRYYENQARVDGVMPLSDNTSEEENDATRTFHEDAIVEDLDTIDDADEALQGIGLQYQEESLVRSAPDEDGTQDYHWENELDPDMFPTIYESQCQDTQDAPSHDYNYSFHQATRPFVVPYGRLAVANEGNEHALFEPHEDARDPQPTLAAQTRQTGTNRVGPSSSLRNTLSSIRSFRPVREFCHGTHEVGSQSWPSDVPDLPNVAEENV